MKSEDAGAPWQGRPAGEDGAAHSASEPKAHAQIVDLEAEEIRAAVKRCREVGLPSSYLLLTAARLQLAERWRQIAKERGFEAAIVDVLALRLVGDEMAAAAALLAEGIRRPRVELERLVAPGAGTRQAAAVLLHRSTGRRGLLVGTLAPLAAA